MWGGSGGGGEGGENIHSSLGGCEVGDHLHDFNLRIVLVGTDMAAIINEKVKQFTRRGRSVRNSSQH